MRCLPLCGRNTKEKEDKKIKKGKKVAILEEEKIVVMRQFQERKLFLTYSST